MPEDVRLSKRVAFVLRHAPESVGLRLDPGGWVSAEALADALSVTRAQLEELAASSAEQRYAVADGRIRAQQGHSVEVDLGLEASTPPPVLWHGTAERSLPAVLDQGLSRRGRHAVHLSADPGTAHRVGARHGRPVVLRVDARAMAADGWLFTVSGNGVWLVEHVPPRYLSRED